MIVGTYTAGSVNFAEGTAGVIGVRYFFHKLDTTDVDWIAAIFSENACYNLLSQTHTHGRKNRLSLATSLQAVESVQGTTEAALDRCLVAKNSV